MKKVADVLNKKGGEVFSARPSDTLKHALEVMKQHNIGSLVVITENGEVAGIFSERDFARYCAGKDGVDLGTRISEVMTARVVCVDPEQTIEHCMAIMTQLRFRHLPVLVDNKLSGVISIGDVVKESQSEKDYLIDQLEHYITGSL